MILSCLRMDIIFENSTLPRIETPRCNKCAVYTRFFIALIPQMRVKILLVFGNISFPPSRQDRIARLEMRANEFIAKPYNIKQLIHKIKKYQKNTTLALHLGDEANRS